MSANVSFAFIDYDRVAARGRYARVFQTSGPGPNDEYAFGRGNLGHRTGAPDRFAPYDWVVSALDAAAAGHRPPAIVRRDAAANIINAALLYFRHPLLVGYHLPGKQDSVG